MLKEAIRVLNNVVERRGGIKPEFSRYHAYLALELLIDGKPMGRKSLSKALGIGEGSVRTLIRRLKEFGLVSIDPVAGVVITNLGLRVIGTINSRLDVIGYVDVDRCNICDNCRIAAVLLRGGVSDVMKVGVLHVRDLIVRNGGRGGLILFYIDNELKLPNSKELHRVERLEPLNTLLSGRDVTLVNGDCIVASICLKGDEYCLMYVIEAAFEVLSN